MFDLARAWPSRISYRSNKLATVMPLKYTHKLSHLSRTGVTDHPRWQVRQGTNRDKFSRKFTTCWRVSLHPLLLQIGAAKNTTCATTVGGSQQPRDVRPPQRSLEYFATRSPLTPTPCAPSRRPRTRSGVRNTVACRYRRLHRRFTDALRNHLSLPNDHQL